MQGVTQLLKYGRSSKCITARMILVSFTLHFSSVSVLNEVSTSSHKNFTHVFEAFLYLCDIAVTLKIYQYQSTSLNYGCENPLDQHTIRVAQNFSCNEENPRKSQCAFSKTLFFSHQCEKIRCYDISVKDKNIFTQTA